MLHRTEEAKFSLRKERVKYLGRFYRENPNEQNRNTTGRKGREPGSHLRLRKGKSRKVMRAQVQRTASGLTWLDQGVQAGQ